MIESCVISVENIPLRRPFVTSQDKAGRTHSNIVRLVLTSNNGLSGAGEGVPVTYVTGETIETVRSDIDSIKDLLVGIPIDCPYKLRSILDCHIPNSPTARAAVEIAYYQLMSGHYRTSLDSLFGGHGKSVTSDITLSIGPDFMEAAEEYYNSGHRLFKLKVGDKNVSFEVAKVATLVSELPGIRLRIDANQAYSPSEALSLVRSLEDYGSQIDFVEQPVASDDFLGLDEIARLSPIPIFADESVKSPKDALRIINTTSVHGINIKLMKSGIFGAMDIVAIARAAGKDLMIGCMLESRYGISVSLAFAAGTGAFRYVDLDSHLLLNEMGHNPYFDQTSSLMKLLS